MKKTAIVFFFAMLFQCNLFAQEASKEIPKEKAVLIIYGSDECHHCIDTKKYIKDHSIDFVFFDIDKNQDALKEMLSKLKKAGISTSNLGIPVVDKNGVIFTNNIVFEEFLEKLK